MSNIEIKRLEAEMSDMSAAYEYEINKLQAQLDFDIVLGLTIDEAKLLKSALLSSYDYYNPDICDKLIQKINEYEK